MKKISTLFKKNPERLGRVINEVNPENEWVFTEGIPTRKFDGTSVVIIDGELYKRYDVKKGRQVPDGAIPCQEADKITGHHPHWIKCDPSDNSNRYHLEGFNSLAELGEIEDGTYELIGEKIQGNPEKIEGHHLVKHGSEVLLLADYSFEYFQWYLSKMDIEGIVFHHKKDDRMCKLRKSDFGIKR